MIRGSRSSNTNTTTAAMIMLLFYSFVSISLTSAQLESYSQRIVQRTTVAMGQTGSSVNGILVGDFTAGGGGTNDVITGGSSGVTLVPNTIMPATYDGAAVPVVGASGGIIVESLCSGDLNGDGLPDFVYALNGDSTASIKVGLQQSGSSGSFSMSTALPATGVQNFVGRAVGRSVKVEDMDGDGFKDIVATINGADGEAGKGALVYLRNTGNGLTFETTYIDESIGGVGLVQIMDLDGDARLDIVVLGVDSKKLAVYFNEPGGTGAVGNFTKVILDEAVESNLCMATGDFNNAGQGDILAIGQNSMHFYLNYYQRNFQKWDMFSVMATSETMGTSTDYHHYACDLYDMDGNGLTDIVYTQGLQNVSE
jgi:FG-GAP-like repeat